MKLCFEDIRILDRYEQLSNAISGKFDSIDTLEAELGYSCGTLSRYLRDPELLSPGKHDKLKSKIFRYLGQSLSEILLNESEQVKSYIDNIYVNVDMYVTEEDNSIFERLEKSCLQYEIKAHLAHLYVAWGRYCFNMKIPLQANKYYWKAIDLYKGMYLNNEIVKCYNELGYISTYLGNYEEAKSLFFEADCIIKKACGINPENLFHHYYRWGHVLNKEQIGDHSHAREKFIIAMSYAADKKDIGSSYISIGLSYKKQGQFNQAKKYYKKALEINGNECNPQCGIVYNNLAELEKCTGNYNKALFYINKAFEINNGIHGQDYIVFFQTYTQIKALRNENEDTLKTLLTMIKDYKEHYVHKTFEIAAIKTVLEFGNLEVELLKELKGVVYNLIVSAEDECSSYTKELMECLGKIEFAVLSLSQGL